MTDYSEKIDELNHIGDGRILATKAELLQLLQDAQREAAEKVFIDFPTAWEVTKTAKTHEIDCSWEQEHMMCDCSVLKAAQHAVDKAKERIESQQHPKHVKQEGGDNGQN